MSNDKRIAEVLLGRTYRGESPFSRAEFVSVPDSTVGANQFSNFLLEANGLSTAIIDVDDAGSEITAVFDFRSSNPATPYTASTQIVPKAFGFLGFIDHIRAIGPGFDVNEPAGSSAYLLGTRVAIDGDADFALTQAASLAYALDTSPALVPSLTLGATGAAAYTGLGGSSATNGGLTVRQAIWNQTSFFNAATASWRCEIHVKLSLLSDMFRRMGVRYGLPIQQLQVYWNTGIQSNSYMPVVVLTGEPAPVISVLGAGNSWFKYRRYTPSESFSRALQSHISTKPRETIEFVMGCIVPGVSGLTTPNPPTLNLGPIQNVRRIIEWLYPSGSQYSATSLYPAMQNIAPYNWMMKVGGMQQYDRLLAQPNQNNNNVPEFQELFRETQDSMPVDERGYYSRGQFDYLRYMISTHFNSFRVRDGDNVQANQSILIQQQIAPGTSGITPSSGTPIDIFVLAEIASWLHCTYEKQDGVWQPKWTLETMS